MNNLRKIFAFALVAAVIFGTVGFAGTSKAALANGVLVKSDASSAVYYHNGGKLYVFPNSKIYFSWFSDFSSVMTVSQSELQQYPLGGNVSYRPGSRLIKTTISAPVYVVGYDSTIHAIANEADAIALWGSSWNMMVDDVPESFFTAYTVGSTKGAGIYGEGQLVKHASSADVYLYTGTQYRKLTENGFNANRFSFRFVATAPESLSFVPMGSDITGAETDLWNVAGSSTNVGNNQGEFDPNGGTQGSIDSIDLGSREDTEALEGEEDVEIYATDFELSDDGALMLQRADIWFEETAADAGGESSRPWDYFTEVSLMVNGEVVATQDADRSEDWSDDTTGNITAGGAGEEYRMRFSGLDGVLSNDDTTKVSVAVSMQDNLDSADQLATWNIELGSFRVLDESGFVADEDAADFSSATALEDSFSVDAEESAQLDVRDAADEIDAMIIEVDTDNDTDGVAIYNFTIEEQNGVDVNIEEMGMTFTVAATTTGDNENEVIKRAYLYQGNNKVGEETVPDAGAVVFDNMDIDVAGDDEETFTVKVDLYDTNDGTRYVDGTTIVAAVGAASTFEATDENDNEVEAADISVSATSDTHQLRANGISVALVGAPTAVVTVVEGSVAAADANGDLVTFTWTFDVTAFGDNAVYINRDVADVVLADAAADVDTIYSVEVSGGATLTGQSGTVTTSTAATIATGSVGDFNAESFYKVEAGDTERITVTVVGKNQTQSKLVRGLLENIEWASIIDAGSADIAYTFNLGVDAATPFVAID